MLTAILLLALASPPAAPPARPVQVLDFAALTPAGLDALDGRRVTLRIERWSHPDELGRWWVIDCYGPVRDDGLHRTAWLYSGQPKGEVMIVTGRLRVIHYRAREDFEAFTEVRLLGGVVERIVKPWDGD